MGANSDTVGTLALNGTLAGTGTLTAATYTLNGAAVNANLGTGSLVQAGGTSVPLPATAERAATFAKAQAYIASRLRDADLSIEQVCEAANVPRTTLYRLFTSYGGIRAYIKQQRMLQASAMLFDNTRYYSVAELASMWRFADPSHFVRAFQKHHGWPPHQYRMMSPADRVCHISTS